VAPQTADIRGKRPVAPNPPGAYIPPLFQSSLMT